MDSGQRRLVAVMPLHAITSAYGEEGLRERFAAEIAPLPEAERHRLGRALDLAARLHAGDRRGQEPYLNHLLRVAIRIMCHYDVRDSDVICAALLHDSVEDHAAELAATGADGSLADGSLADGSLADGSLADGSLADGSLADGGGAEAALGALAARFGPRVAELVAAVTNPWYEPGCDADEQYRDHVAASLRRCPWARVIKASDFTDNGAGLIYYSGPRLRKLAGKYAPLVPILRELIARPDTPLTAPARQRILAQLGRAEARFAALLDGESDSR